MSIDNLELRKLMCWFKQAGLPDDFFLDLIGESLLVKYPKDARLFLQGTPADNLMIVTSGAVKIYSPHVGERSSVMLSLAGPGEIVGYADFLDGKNRFCEAFEAQALSSCAVTLVSRQRIERELGKLAPTVLLGLMEAANTFWASLVYRCVTLMGMTFRERLEAVIAEVAEKFGIKDNRGILLNLDLGHEEWAALIGSSRSLASKLLSEMIDKGLLQRAGRRYTVLKDSILKKGRQLLSNQSGRPEAGDGRSRANGRVQNGGPSLSAAAPEPIGAKRLALS